MVRKLDWFIIADEQIKGEAVDTFARAEDIASLYLFNLPAMEIVIATREKGNSENVFKIKMLWKRGDDGQLHTIKFPKGQTYSVLADNKEEIPIEERVWDPFFNGHSQLHKEIEDREPSEASLTEDFDFMEED